MHVTDKEKHCGRRNLIHGLCPDDQHPSESSVNIVFLQQTASFAYELNMRNYLCQMTSFPLLQHGTCTPDKYIVSNVSDIMMMSSRIT